MNKNITEGYKAHENHMHRTDNPYLTKAMLWDRGWIKRQIEELEKSGMNTSRIKRFKRWIGSS